MSDERRTSGAHGRELRLHVFEGARHAFARVLHHQVDELVLPLLHQRTDGDPVEGGAEVPRGHQVKDANGQTDCPCRT